MVQLCLYQACLRQQIDTCTYIIFKLSLSKKHSF